MTNPDDYGTIVAVGGPELLAEVHRGDDVVSLDDQFVTAGFWDSHVHLLDYGRSFSRLQFGPDESLVSLLEAVGKRAAASPGEEWIVGSGWNLQSLGGVPDQRRLDFVAPRHPVVLISLDYHTVWINTAASRRLGGGLPKVGTSGLLREGAAFEVQARVARDSGGDDVLTVKRSAQALSRLGFVGVVAIESREGFSALQRWGREGLRRIRVNMFVRDGADAMEALGMEAGFGNAFLSVLGVKLFADGALGSHTAWMQEPYEGTDTHIGTAVLSRAAIDAWVDRLARARLVPAIHAIGDRAVLETVAALAGCKDLTIKPRVEHAQLMGDQALALVANSPNVALSMQPVHLLVDRGIADDHWGARARHAFRFRDIVDRGVVLTFGSDAPVADPNPILGLWSAVHRARPGDQPWYPEQRLTPEEAIWCYTRGAALADGRQSGMVAPGFWGDFTLWREDPAQALRQEAFDRLAVTGTVVAGRRVT